MLDDILNMSEETKQIVRPEEQRMIVGVVTESPN
jgi:hypothetical protein